jgi:uncharacterized protein with PIN domain
VTPSEFQKKNQCPHCGESVRFDEIHTRTYTDLPEGKKKVRVAVLRCPECKRIAGPGIPLKPQRKEI